VPALSRSGVMGGDGWVVKLTLQLVYALLVVAAFLVPRSVGSIDKTAAAVAFMRRSPNRLWTLLFLVSLLYME
jgi:hypothetical protein